MSISQQRDHLLNEFASMVPVKPMGIDITALTESEITLTAPLALHVNDKGNAFGGSLTSIMTLACWGLVTAITRHHGLTCDVYVGESTVRYLKPVEQDIVVRAFVNDPNRIDAFIAQLFTKSKARLEMTAQTELDSGVAAATLEARYVAFVKR